MKWRGQICDNCSCNQHFSYQVTDELWAKLPKKWDESSILCIECFLSELEKINPDLELSLDDFHHLAFIGNNNGFGGIVFDSDRNSKWKKIYLKK